MVEVAQHRGQAVATVAGKQVGGFAALHQVGFELGQCLTGLRQRGQGAAGLGGGVGRQAFVVPLQPQKSVGVAGDDVYQPPTRVGAEFGRLGCFADEAERSLQLGGVGLEPLAVNGVAQREVLARMTRRTSDQSRSMRGPSAHQHSGTRFSTSRPTARQMRN